MYNGRAPATAKLIIFCNGIAVWPSNGGAHRGGMVSWAWFSSSANDGTLAKSLSTVWSYSSIFLLAVYWAIEAIDGQLRAPCLPPWPRLNIQPPKCNYR